MTRNPGQLVDPPGTIPAGYQRDHISHDRNGTRWTLYGLPGGFMRARRVGDSLDPSLFRHAVPLVTVRADLTYTDRTARRLDRAMSWALDAYDLVP